jgi:hypothetical protein
MYQIKCGRTFIADNFICKIFSLISISNSNYIIIWNQKLRKQRNIYVFNRQSRRRLFMFSLSQVYH